MSLLGFGAIIVEEKTNRNTLAITKMWLSLSNLNTDVFLVIVSYLDGASRIRLSHVRFKESLLHVFFYRVIASRSGKRFGFQTRQGHSGPVHIHRQSIIHISPSP